MPAAAMDDRRTADGAADVLPLEARMPRGALLMAWAGICSAMVYIFLGANLALVYGARNAVIGMMLAVATFGVLCGYLGKFAARTGMSSSVLSQAMLGRAGGTIATLILSATGIYFAVFEGSVLAVTMHRVIPGLGYGLASLLVAAYSVPLVLGSVQNWLNRLNGVLLPFYLAGIVGLVLTVILQHGDRTPFWSVGPRGSVPPFGWWYCFASYLGVLVMVMATMDFARFGRPEDETWHARFTFGAPFYAVTYLLNGCVGILLMATLTTSTISETAVVDVSLSLLGAWLGLGWVFVSQTRINTANFLLGSLNLQAFLLEAANLRVSKALCAVLIGGVTFALMRSTDVFKYLVLALNWQAVFTTAWVGVALSYVASLAGGPVKAGGRAGLSAWLMGALAGGLTLASAPSGLLWYPIVTVAVAIVSHRLLLARAAAPVAQRADP